LLFVTQTLPFPPDGGVNIRTFNVLRILATRYEVDLVCFYRKRIARDIVGSVAALKDIVCSVEVFPIPQEHSMLRLVGDHLQSMLSRTVYTRFVYKNDLVRLSLRRIISERRPDLVHIDSLDLATYLPDLAGLPTVLVHHNIESALLHRRASAERSRIVSSYVAHQAKLMRKEERAFSTAASLNVVCSAADAAALRSIAGQLAVEVIPNGVDIGYFAPGDSQMTCDIVSVGGMTWFPNKDAVEYFGCKILPIIRERRHNASVTWVGRANAAETALQDTRGIQMTGYVSDVRPLVRGGTCFVAPIRVGGGTRLKLLDAWAMGKAIVSTSVGAEGLSTIDGENILLRDEPEAFADAVVSVISNKQLRERLEKGARETAVSEYSWDSIGSRMLQLYEAVHAKG
jgi:polysaccharide biosynthesis protein PslH